MSDNKDKEQNTEAEDREEESLFLDLQDRHNKSNQNFIQRLLNHNNNNKNDKENKNNQEND